jgi:ribosomal protein S18 acetylase RimI-like enzyme
LAGVTVRRAHTRDAPQLSILLSEWLKFEPKTGRTKSIRRAIRKREFLVAEANSKVIGFVHFVMHEDVVDGGPNAFITAFYVSRAHRRRGVGSRLLRAVVADSVKRGAVEVETSTIHRSAKRFYERRHFRQTMGDMAEAFLELDVDEYMRATRAFGSGHANALRR